MMGQTICGMVDGRGKETNFQSKSIFPKDVEELSGEGKGWIATIYGQLMNRVSEAHLSEGWVVFEDYEEYVDTLYEALSCLRGNNLINYGPIVLLR